MILNRSNRFKLLEIPQDPTDYEDFEDIPPYNKLEDGKWTSLWMNRHPNARNIIHRFSSNYDGKLMWRELNSMEERIKKRRKALNLHIDNFSDSCWELRKRIRYLKNLCKECEKEYINNFDTIILSTLNAKEYNEIDEDSPLGSFIYHVDDAMSIMNYIISFIEPKETCAQKLQKHLDKCMGFDGTGRHKCTKDYISYDCQFKENGRCDHYYEIERAKEELGWIESYEYDENMEIEELEYYYKRALAVKEDRLKEYLDELYYSDY